MVFCVVVNSSNRTPRDSKRGITFDRFPLKSESLLNEWLIQIKRENLPKLHHRHVCSDHFENSCFEVKLKRKLLPKEGRCPYFVSIQKR